MIKSQYFASFKLKCNTILDKVIAKFEKQFQSLTKITFHFLCAAQLCGMDITNLRKMLLWFSHYIWQIFRSLNFNQKQVLNYEILSSSGTNKCYSSNSPTCHMWVVSYSHISKCWSYSVYTFNPFHHSNYCHVVSTYWYW